ncbi:colicin release lysis protein, partial [Escherichia coli]
MKKKIGGSMILVLAVLCLTACQANYVRDVNRPGFPGECFICELRLPD